MREKRFEILRVFAMLFIVIYHLCTHGIGCSIAYDFSSPQHIMNLIITDFFLVISSTCVNIYVMISGYFLVCSSFKPSRIVRTWFLTCFYSLFITSIFFLTSIHSFDGTRFVKCLFPLSTDSYWFVTQYIGMLILSPLLSQLARNLSYKQYLYLLGGMGFLCLSIIPDFPLGKRFNVAHGNSLFSFVYLFFVAGFIRLHPRRIPTRNILIMLTLSTIINLTWAFINGVHSGYGHIYWFNYNSIPFFISIFIFIYARQVTLPDNIVITLLSKIAPYTFAVYLIHDHLFVRDFLWNTLFFKNHCYDIGFPFFTLLICILIFTLCIGVDFCRHKVFRLLRIDNLFKKLDSYSQLFSY